MGTPQVPAAITPPSGPPPSQKKKRKIKRALVSEKKQKRAARLEQFLVFARDEHAGLEKRLYALLEEFPEEDFAEIILAAARALPDAIEAARRLAARDRKGDRNAVARVLDSWERVTLEEIVEDAELSRWAVWNILQSFNKAGLLTVTSESAKQCEGQKPSHLYGWKHSPGATQK